MKIRERANMYVRALPRAFYDPLQYRDAAQSWTGFGALYLLILSTIISIFVVSLVGYSAYLFRKNELPTIVEQMPTIEIANGEVSVKGQEPTVISNKDQKIKVIIDTKSEPDAFQKQEVTLGVGKDFVVYKTRGGYETRGLQNFKERMIIDAPTIKNMFSNLSRIVPLVLYPLSVISQFINYMFQALCIALCSYIVTSLLRLEFSLETRMRLAALALTPAVFITTASLIILQHQMAMWFNLLLALLFLYVMLMLLRRQPPVEVV